MGDHLLYRYASGETRGPWEAWTTLAALAEATERVALGPLVAATAFHAPFMLAKQAATVDEVSGGRLVLGLGAGWNDTEFEALGAPFDHRISRFEESFTVVRTLLAEGAIDFEGTYVRARGAELRPRPARPGGPLLLIGSSGPRMLAATLPHADGWNAWYADTGNAPAGVAPLRAVVDAAAVGAGRDPAAIERTVAVLVRLPGGTGRVMGDTDPKQAVAPLEGPPERHGRGRCAPTRARASATSSSSSIRSPRRRSPPWRPCWRRSIVADSPFGIAGLPARDDPHGRVRRVLASAPIRTVRHPLLRGSAHAATDPATPAPGVVSAR